MNKTSETNNGSAVDVSAQSLRVLLIEDSEIDAAMFLHELRSGGFNPVCRRVDMESALVEALKEEPWEIVVSDNKLPDLDVMRALELVRQRGMDCPFLIVSGEIS